MKRAHDDTVHFFFQNLEYALTNRRRLKRFVRFIFESEGKRLGSVNFIFCSDAALLKINRQYLKHDYYTDVIAFNSGEKASQIIGDVFISLDRVKENAKAFNTSTRKEIHRVIFHSILHLCGYDDKRKLQKQVMREKETKYLKLYFDRFT